MAKFNFSFTGEINLNGLETKNPYFKEGVSKSKKKWKRFSCSVVEAKNNRAYCEVMSMEQDTINTMDTDNNKIEIAWADRNDKDVISTVANYKKHIVVLPDGSRHEFIADYDFVNFLIDNADEIKGKKFTVTGQVADNVYNGTISQRFNIQNMYAAADDVRNKLSVSMDYFWSVDDYEFDDFKTEHKIYINGYINTFIDKATLGTEKGANKYVPLRVTFDMSRVDWENEKHCLLTDFKLKQLGIERDDNKVSTTLKKKKIYRLPIECSYVNGQEEIPFDESTLSDNQKAAIACGLKTLDDFKPTGRIYGERIVEFKVRDFVLRDDSADGCYDSEITPSDFDDEILVIGKAETMEEFEEKVEQVTKKEEKKPEVNDDLFDLFG